MSASTLCYRPHPEGNGALRQRLEQLACEDRRHGRRMLHSCLRLEGWLINIKRTYRLYRQQGLMVRQRRRKKLTQSQRQPLVRLMQPNQVRSMDFVFDELADGRRVKALMVVNDCSKEAVQIAADTSIPARYLTRVLD
jgi:putative transposase